MRGKVTVFFVFLFVFAMVVSAADTISKRMMLPQHKMSVKAKKISPEKVQLPFAQQQSAASNTTYGVRQTAAADMMQIGTSGNGYGWLMPHSRSIDRFAGNDFDSGDPIDYLLVGFRGHGDGNADMAVGEVNLESGLANGTLSLWEGGDAVNMAIDPYGSGARYPVVVAQDRPAICFNQYVGDVTVPTDPARSHPYLITDYTTYGPGAGAWTSPDFLMDDGWVNPTVATMPTPENRLWNGPVAISKDDDGIYHYLAVYETWYTDAEKQIYGVDNEQHIITAKSDGPDMSNGWIKSWEDTPASNPVWIDTNKVQLYRKGVAMNSSGFGVVLGAGHLGHSDASKDYYYEYTRITYSITRDYGLTWTDWDTVSLTAMGFPGYIRDEDKWIIESINEVTGDTTWYDGPAFNGMNFDQSVMVDENNTIWVTFSSLWGSKSVDGWYPNYRYSGIFLAKKVDGQDWGAARIAFNNGIWQGDDYVEGRSQYFFDNESQISMDETGNVYCAWLDRRHNDVQVSQFSKYSDPDDNGGTIYNDYKTDVYASHSVNGGQDWSDPINLTNTPSGDEYELNMALHSRNQNSATEGDYGRIWVGFVMADTAGHDPAHDAMIEMSNDVWVAEGQGFNPPAAIDTKPVVANNYSLKQNYPNPFNPVTTIKYQMPVRGHVTLTVYNALGQKVRQLVDATQTAGEHVVTFNASNLASGIYYYKIAAGDFVQVRKMALLK